MLQRDTSPKPSADDKEAERRRLRALILAETRPIQPPLVPELEIYGADDYAALWQATEDRLEALALPPPFWAFAWAGGQALARRLLDEPHWVRGRSVLAIAAGAGVEALAAARSGAARVVANDVDQAACVAAELNAERNDATIELCAADLLADPNGGALSPLDADLVLLGDALYEKELAARMLALLRRAARSGATVLIGDGGRGFAPSRAVARIGAYRVPTPPALEDQAHRDVALLRLLAG